MTYNELEKEKPSQLVKIWGIGWPSQRLVGSLEVPEQGAKENLEPHSKII